MECMPVTGYYSIMNHLAEEKHSLPEKLLWLLPELCLENKVVCIWVISMHNARGHAKDYVVAMWLMLQQETPEDYVIATGKTTSVRDFLKMAFSECGIVLKFSGENENEIGQVVACSDSKYQLEIGKVVVKVDQNYYRPTEVDLLIGNPKKANEKLNWYPKYDLSMLVKEMMINDLTILE